VYVWLDWRRGEAYLNPNERYPEALPNHIAMGLKALLSHGRFMTKLAKEGADILAVFVGGEYD